MELETLLIFSCIFSNNYHACDSMGQAYYKYEKLDEFSRSVEENIKRHINPATIFGASVIVGIQNRKTTFFVYKGTSITVDFPKDGEQRSSINYKYSF